MGVAIAMVSHVCALPIVCAHMHALASNVCVFSHQLAINDGFFLVKTVAQVLIFLITGM